LFVKLIVNFNDLFLNRKTPQHNRRERFPNRSEKTKHKEKHNTMQFFKLLILSTLIFYTGCKNDPQPTQQTENQELQELKKQNALLQKEIKVKEKAEAERLEKNDFNKKMQNYKNNLNKTKTTQP
jgi:hypothetical protein